VGRKKSTNPVAKSLASPRFRRQVTSLKKGKGSYKRPTSINQSSQLHDVDDKDRDKG
jgi:stalled ribosome alternative rescue factor ArfA